MHKTLPQVTGRARNQAVLGLVVCTLLYLSAQTTSTLNITLVVAMGPVVTFMFSWWLLNSPPRANQVAGLIISFAGLQALVFLGEPIRGYHVAGKAMIFTGFYVALFVGRGKGVNLLR